MNAHAILAAPRPSAKRTATLSPRELEALTWAAKGKTYWETAQILGIAYASVHSHINGLKLKLNAANVTHAVARGYELGIIQLHTAEPRVMMVWAPQQREAGREAERLVALGA